MNCYHLIVKTSRDKSIDFNKVKPLVVKTFFLNRDRIWSDGNMPDSRTLHPRFDCPLGQIHPVWYICSIYVSLLLCTCYKNHCNLESNRWFYQSRSQNRDLVPCFGPDYAHVRYNQHFYFGYFLRKLWNVFYEQIWNEFSSRSRIWSSTGHSVAYGSFAVQIQMYNHRWHMNQSAITSKESFVSWRSVSSIILYA